MAALPGVISADGAELRRSTRKGAGFATALTGDRIGAPTDAMLEAQLNEQVARKYGSNHRLASCNMIAAGSWSRVYRGASTAYASPIAIKLCLDPITEAPSPTDAEQQFKALALAREKLQGPDCSVPKPLDLFSEVGVLIMEWIDGSRLRDVFLGQGADRKQSIRLAKFSGRWLRELHDARRLEPQPLPTQAMLDNVDQSFAKAGMSFGRRATAARRLLGETASTVSNTEVPWSWSHGDFKPRNVLVANGALFGIDLALQYDAPVLGDLAQFLNHLEMLRFDKQGMRRWRILRALPEAALAGYSGDDEPLPMLPLLWVRLQNALRLSVRHGEWNSAWIRSIYLRLCFDAMEAQLIEEISRLR